MLVVSSQNKELNKDFIRENASVRGNGGGRSLGKLGEPPGLDASLTLSE